MGDKIHMKRQMGIPHGVAVVCGLIVGSGIYIAPKGVLEQTKSVGLSLVMWGLGGVLATLGALSFVELGTTFPGSGEKYHYLKKTCGSFVAFMYLWFYLMMFRPGANAVKCLTFARYVLQPSFPECDIPHRAILLIAVLLACLLTFVNCVSVRLAVNTQTVFTSISMLALTSIAITGIVHMSMGATDNLKNAFQDSTVDAGDIALSIYAVIWSYWGWNALNFMVEELKDPFRNLPRVIYISMVIVTLISVGVNLSYFAVLGADGILESKAVAVTFAQKTMGVMAWIMPVCIAINTAGSFNAGSLVGSRLCFVGARSGDLPDVLSLLHVRFLSPVTALLFQLILVIILGVSVDLYTLLNNLVFANTLFDVINVGSLLWFRWKQPDLPRPIKMPLFIPIAFFLCMLFLAVTPLFTKPYETMIGCLLIILTGVPYYFIFIKWKKPMTYRNWVGKQTIRVQKLLYSVQQEGDIEF